MPSHGTAVQESALESLLPEPASASKHTHVYDAKSMFKTFGNLFVLFYTAGVILCMTLFIFVFGAFLGRTILDALHWDRPTRTGMTNQERDNLEVESAAFAGFAFAPFLIVLTLWSEKLVPKKWRKAWRWGPIAYAMGVAFVAAGAVILHVDLKIAVPEYLVGAGILFPVLLLVVYGSGEKDNL